MSWAAHDLEPYVLQRHLPRAWGVSFVAILLGSWGPDVFTKWFVYGITVFGTEIKADDPATFHRGWPGAGCTHTLAFGVVLGAVCFALTRHRGWSIGLLVGSWAHVLSDTLDSYGTMLFFPISTELIHFDMWRYTSPEGRFGDAAAYYSGLGAAWDAFWVFAVIVNWRALTWTYFRDVVAPADPFWSMAGRFLPPAGLIVLYRGAALYGAARLVAWLIWAHVLHDYPFDLRWTGPSWARDYGDSG